MIRTRKVSTLALPPSMLREMRRLAQNATPGSVIELPAVDLAKLRVRVRRCRELGTVTVTNTYLSNDIGVWSVVASADGDTTTGAISHTLGANALIFTTPILSQALTALSAWAVAITQTTWTGTKLASTGSGNASPQLLVTIMRTQGK